MIIRATADNKMAAKRQSNSSHFLVSLLWINKETEATLEHDISSSVMKVLLRTFELHPNDAAIATVAGNVEDTLNKELGETLQVDFRVRILIKGKAGNHPRKEQNKIVLVKLSDVGGESAVMVFRIINRNNVLSLRSQAAAKIARCFLNQKVKAVGNLDVPRNVVEDIHEVLDDISIVNTFIEYFSGQNCCAGCAVLKIANQELSCNIRRLGALWQCQESLTDRTI